MFFIRMIMRSFSRQFKRRLLIAVTVCLSAAVSVARVSYTHLDVYKRQPVPGTHEELLAGNGFYADIYNSQLTLIA